MVVGLPESRQLADLSGCRGVSRTNIRPNGLGQAGHAISPHFQHSAPSRSSDFGRRRRYWRRQDNNGQRSAQDPRQRVRHRPKSLQPSILSTPPIWEDGRANRLLLLVCGTVREPRLSGLAGTEGIRLRAFPRNSQILPGALPGWRELVQPPKHRGLDRSAQLVGRPKLAHGVSDVEVDGGLGNAQDVGNLFGCLAVGSPAQALNLLYHFRHDVHSHRFPRHFRERRSPSLCRLGARSAEGRHRDGHGPLPPFPRLRPVCYRRDGPRVRERRNSPVHRAPERDMRPGPWP